MPVHQCVSCCSGSQAGARGGGSCVWRRQCQTFTSLGDAQIAEQAAMNGKVFLAFSQGKAPLHRRVT